MEPYRVRRRDLARALNKDWRARLRSGTILAPLGFGLVLIVGAASWYWISSDFARRSVVTAAVVERVTSSYRLEREEGPPIRAIHGVVRYEVSGQVVRSRVHLRNCTTPRCISGVKPGIRLTVAYDPDKVTRAKVAPARGLSTFPSGLILLLGGLGTLFIATAAYILAFESF